MPLKILRKKIRRGDYWMQKIWTVWGWNIFKVITWQGLNLWSRLICTTYIFTMYVFLNVTLLASLYLLKCIESRSPTGLSRLKKIALATKLNLNLIPGIHMGKERAEVVPWPLPVSCCVCTQKRNGRTNNWMNKIQHFLKLWNASNAFSEEV